MDYAIIKLGNKQHRVRDGETLVVDRVRAEEGKSFEPAVLLGDGTVTATVVAHERGPKILVGKYRKRTGYKRHNGFRAATSRLTISFGSEAKRPAKHAESTRAAARPATPPVEAPAAAEAGSEAAAAPGLPSGYEALTVAQITSEAKGWSHAALEAALAHERDHAARKGALAALEAALAREEKED